MAIVIVIVIVTATVSVTVTVIATEAATATATGTGTGTWTGTVAMENPREGNGIEIVEMQIGFEAGWWNWVRIGEMGTTNPTLKAWKAAEKLVQVE
mmetsp:Transcript_2784/g.11415  ORF Transcript_2784/g.11415 Transcript_2784/m.11415 type:complete len:96 (-) Transcript_2784:687-974(-)